MNDLNIEDLLEKVVSELRLHPDTVHGPDHWKRVERNGLIICESEEIDPTVLRYFSILHDSQRFNDGYDVAHGPRAVEYAHKIKDDYIELDDEQFEQLCFAMEYHTVGAESDEPVVHVCWDADRLDLGRVFIVPDPKRMLTDTAKGMCGTFITDEHFE
jgi:uncharacterized protein